MDQIIIEGVFLTPLKQIFHPKGNILHGMKQSDPGFSGFGEAYFSTINAGDVKGWKKHLRMTMNLVVPVGKIRFVIYDDRKESSTNGKFFSVIIDADNYQRITLPPGVWLGFQGLAKDLNLLLNIADMEHDLTESENIPLESFCYNWRRVND